MGILRWVLGFLRGLDEGMARMREPAPFQQGLPPDPLLKNALREPEAEALRSTGGGIAVKVMLSRADARQVDVGLYKDSVLTVSGLDGYGAFRRSFVLPEEVARDGIRAVVYEGTLWVTAPGAIDEMAPSFGDEYPARLEVESA